MTIRHANGGTIVEVREVGHDTYDGIASWFFVGTVAWNDGTRSPAAEIAPWALCCDEEDAQGKAVVTELLRQLSEYLDAQGKYHGARHKRDGRVYHWTPRKKSGRAPVATSVAEVGK